MFQAVYVTDFDLHIHGKHSGGVSPKMEIPVIAEELGKDRSTIQRYLSKLRTTGLLERKSVVDEGKRGRYYIYTVKDKTKMKEKIKQRLDEWQEEKIDVLEEI